MIYLQLIFEFFKTGLFAIGGGLATIPFLKEISAKHPEWFTLEELTDFIAVSESTPGPIGINIATYVGCKTAGVFGGLIASLALVAPSVIIVLIISRFLQSFRENIYVDSAMRGIRPSTVGLISGAMYGVFVTVLFNAAKYEEVGNFFKSVNVIQLALMALFIAAIAFFKKVHPIVFIAVGACLGIILKL